MSQKTLYITIIVIVVILVAGVAYWYISSNQATQSQTASSSQGANNTAPEGTQDTSGTTATSPALTYTQALDLYKNKRIQFSSTSETSCVADPNSVVFKKGTAVMFDNRTDTAMNFALDGQKYSVKAYGFKILTVTTAAKLPHVMSIDCGTGQNNGSITLE